MSYATFTGLEGENFGFWILDFGFWILDFGFWILDFGFWILDFGNLRTIARCQELYYKNLISGED
jgi:hypothetical protein